jgi:integrase
MAKQTIEGFPACGSQRLDDKYVKALPLPATGTTRVWDVADKNPKKPWLSGFGMRLSSGGTKSFILRYRNAKGEDKIFTIGDFPVWGTEAARNEAFDLKRRIVRDGADPVAEKQADREAPIIATLAERFIKEHAAKKRPKTAKGYEQAINKDILPALGRKRVDAVDAEDVEDLHKAITDRGSSYSANRALACLSKMMSLAVKWRMRPDNPCKGIERNAESKRKRYIQKDELTKLITALDAYENQSAANGFRLLLLTGARTMEVLSAKWEQFDFHRGVWTKPGSTTKQKTEHEAPLNTTALALLRQMREAGGDSPFLFPGDQSGHVGNPKKHWAAICKAAGITGLRVHDLRHSYASMLTSSGHGLPVIGELLGHSNPMTTARYAHLIDDAARAATNKVGAKLAGLVAKRPRGRKLKAIAGGKR